MSTAFFSKLDLGEREQSAAEPVWLTHLRNESIGRLQDEGLPTSKTEAWRFTTLRSLLSDSYTAAGPNTDTEACVAWAQAELGDDETARLFVIDGRPVALHDADGYQVQSLAALLASDPASVQPYLARHAHSEYFGALNSALFADGLHVRVAANKRPAKPLQIVHISDGHTGQTSSYPRLVIVGGANSEFSLVETYLARPGTEANLCTAVTEVCLEDGARMDHLRLVEGNDKSTHLGTLAVSQSGNSHYQSRSVILGGKLSRLEIEATLAGPGAECLLDGAYHAIGNEHVAHHTIITHQDDHGSSSEEYRGLVDDRAHAVFDGIIVVKQGTKNTSAHQQNHNLLLSDSATINTKPHLEIDSDDLTASHGATVGALDTDQLFFLRARGIGEQEARSVLTLSFVRSILDRIKSPAIRHRLVAKVLARLPYGADMSELTQ